MKFEYWYKSKNNIIEADQIWSSEEMGEVAVTILAKFHSNIDKSIHGCGMVVFCNQKEFLSMSVSSFVEIFTNTGKYVGCNDESTEQ